MLFAGIGESAAFVAFVVEEDQTGAAVALWQGFAVYDAGVLAFAVGDDEAEGAVFFDDVDAFYGDFSEPAAVVVMEEGLPGQEGNYGAEGNAINLEETKLPEGVGIVGLHIVWIWLLTIWNIAGGGYTREERQRCGRC